MVHPIWLATGTGYMIVLDANFIYLKKKEFQLKICLHHIACGHICGYFLDCLLMHSVPAHCEWYHPYAVDRPELYQESKQV